MFQLYHSIVTALWEEQEAPEYDIDSEDERWLKQQRHPELTGTVTGLTYIRTVMFILLCPVFCLTMIQLLISCLNIPTFFVLCVIYINIRSSFILIATL